MLDIKVAVIGSGSWATAIVKILLNNVQKVSWWVREEDIAAHLRKYRHNPHYLSSVKFDVRRLDISHNMNDVLRDADVQVFCIPAAFLHQALQTLDPMLLQNKTIVSAIKGIVPETNEIIADYFHNHFDAPYNQFVVVSGPSHAEEVAQEKLTYLTVCAEETSTAASVASLFSCRYIKTSLSNDIFGTEYAPVIKNIIAIASGICTGLGYGDNFHAVLISNAIQEINRFLEAVKPNHRDIKKSVYLGDLLVTCYSQFSRNRRFGQMLAKGYSPKFAQMEMNMVAEGYYATKCIYEMNKEYQVELPIVNAVYEILYKNKHPMKAIHELEGKLS